MSGALNHAFFNGLGSSSFSSALPVQTLLESQKDKKWVKTVADRLEHIGLQQLERNMEFNDFYKMLSGDLVYSDYGLPDLTKEIVKLRDEMDFPVHAKHYDFLGIIVNQIKGEYPAIKDSYKVDNSDPISQNEFVRDRTNKLREYNQKMFNLELERKLLEKGIQVDPNKQFESEEEQQAYMQELEQQKAAIVSPEVIQKEMSKTWKTVAAEWAEKTLEYDQQRFDMDKMNTREIEDYLLTGRWFRHYHIGYDFYKPERWDVRTTFFSEDVNAEYPQDGEYVGRIHYLSPSDIINRYGDKLPEEVIRRLSGYYNKEATGGAPGNHSLKSVIEHNGGETHHVPFEGYYDYDLTLQMQDLFQTPMGQTFIETEDGEKKAVPAWFSPMNGNGYNTNHYASLLRNDIEVRNDLLQLTESYWRSYKRIGVLNYLTEDGFLDQVVTTDDLLPEYLRENEITTLRKISLEECEKNPQPNTICYTWIPEVRWVVKVKAGGSFLKDDLYIGGDALEYQIKGDSNVYDVQLPVAGYIGEGVAKKLRPFIVMHNIVLNQMYSLLEKELGTFFLFDVHYLPSEYKNNGNTRQALEQMYELIQEIGIVPVDTSKANMQGNQPAMNAFMTQSLDFTALINNRMNLANQYKLMALEQIGITEQRKGSPSEYSTAEGIKQGMMASYAQTQPIYDVMSSGAKKANLLHLNVAQYCQKNNKDYSFIYTKSDGEKAFIELSDEHFNLRTFGLTAIGTSKDKKNMEVLKQKLLSDNTMNLNIENFAEIMSSDSITGIIDIGRRAREIAQQEVQAQREHEQQLLDKQIAAQDKREGDKRAHEVKIEEMKNETRLEAEQIQAYGRIDESKTSAELYDRLDKTTQQAIQNGYKEQELGIKQGAVDSKTEQGLIQTNLKLQELKLKMRDQELKEKEIQAKERIATINKN